MTTSIDRLIQFFSESSKPILFTGAGVSARAGIPIWGGLLKKMAEWLRSRDALTANKIVELISKGDLLRAADYLFMSDGVTDKERYQQLCSELLPTHPELLDDLCSLPFQAAVTTNFDRTLLDGIAAMRRIAPQDFRRGDNSFRNASYVKEMYVCRLHGFVEDPQSIVLTRRHFEELETDTYYKDYIVNLFKTSNLLMVGFSFSDPAIIALLQGVNREYGPLSVGDHLALIPEDISSDVLGLLRRLNIETLVYPHKADDWSHSGLWNLIASLAKEIRTKDTSCVSTLTETSESPFETAKTYLASCYARANLGSQIGPLREAIVEGMVSAILQGSAPKAVSFSVLVTKIHVDTSINMHDADQLVSKSLTVLADEKLVNWQKRSGEKKASWIGTSNDSMQLEAAIAKLVDNTVARAFVEEQFRATMDSRKSLNRFFTELVLQRGWDLGAAFASGRIPKSSDLKALMYQCARTIPTVDVELLARVSERMIQNPTAEEAEILAALGRASFGLELALQAPRSTILHSATLPSRIYLDANVIMPAFVEGHTYHSIYAATIASLKQASAGNGGIQICTTAGYLNEVVSHRRLAVELYEQNPDHFREDAIKEAIFSGATNMNVFVGAYANLASADTTLEFPAFLRKSAPFTTEAELGSWLTSRGIYLIKRPSSGGKISFADVSFQLQQGYASSLRSTKDVRLLDHDAVQLCSLANDIERGIRSILVTADRRLRDVVGATKLKHLANHMMSHVGLTQLIDLLVGSPSENRALAHLLWDATISERSNELRRFFIGLALQKYDEALAMELPGLVEKFTDEVVIEAKRKGINVDRRISSEQHAWFQIAGSFEDKFFAAMAERIELRSKQPPG